MEVTAVRPLLPPNRLYRRYNRKSATESSRSPSEGSRIRSYTPGIFVTDTALEIGKGFQGHRMAVYGTSAWVHGVLQSAGRLRTFSGCIGRDMGVSRLQGREVCARRIAWAGGGTALL